MPMPMPAAAALNDTHTDPWHWLVEYADGSQWAEYDAATGQPRPFADALAGVAAHGPVMKLAAVPQYPHIYPGLRPVVVGVPTGARPIVFRRRGVAVMLDPTAPQPDLPPRITALGWQRTVARRNQQTILALYDDGSAVLTTDRASL